MSIQAHWRACDGVKAIECHTQAVQLTPDDHPDKPTRLDDIGTYRYRFECLGKFTDPDQAVEYQTQALQLTPNIYHRNGHPQKPIWFDNLGTAYLSRFRCLCKLTDVDQAIETQTQAVQLTPYGHP